MKRPKLKKASKRMTCHKRYKIQKKVREHNKKLRKEGKKHKHKKPKKDPGVPNAAPFKEEILREAEHRKQQREELKQKQKLARQKELAKKRKQQASTKDAGDEKSTTKQKTQSNHQVQKNSKKSFCEEFKKVIEASDVILEILDARDPLGCRCPQVEQLIAQSEGRKKILLVLNKIDLIPKENLENWLNYLNKDLPTIAFKSAMQIKDRTVQEKRKTKKNAAYLELSRANKCFGSQCLLKLLQEYCITKDEVIQVGVVGFPNVGKSSIINSLKEIRTCNVGPERGLTKSVQAVHIDKRIKMLDSPCILAAPSCSTLALALRSITYAENLVDSVDAVLKHCRKQQIMLHYNIPDYRNSLEFLTLLAQKRGMLKKGGFPDTEGAAKLLLCDWTGAKVSYYSRPPEPWVLSPHLSKEGVATIQEDFNFEELEEDNKNTVNANKYPNQASTIVFQSPGFTDGIMEDNEQPEEALESENAEENDEELTEEEMEDESDLDDVEEESDQLKSSQTPSEELKAKNENLDMLPTDEKQLKTSDLDDAYDFNTDYM
ncbi:PREDICTED: guanine nucleotide-binding protein-like 3 [Thamnophis sirtalis]|uniref:Guanine nucleotide-binding protein-like 3 n=1 Tax=Thamnophis sirtalis TaxID=35019 RepID=A0A6I9YJL5_9SAUR|nr:PREDICTED: guanine nucleotide-binding protein-like 3 [Thamnophis sirtalis]